MYVYDISSLRVNFRIYHLEFKSDNMSYEHNKTGYFLLISVAYVKFISLTSDQQGKFAKHSVNSKEEMKF